MGQTTERVEQAAAEALRDRHRHPYLGGRPLAASDAMPDDAVAVFPGDYGYVAHVDMEALSTLCDGHDCEVYVAALPGRYAEPTQPLAWLSTACDDAARDAVRDAFSIDQARSFDQDPRFGICVLAEIASRALSPAVNDPGTAIDVLGRLLRLLALWTAPVVRDAPAHPRVHVPPIAAMDLFDDAFTPIARDGAGLVEVALRLQKTLRALSRMDAPGYAAAARHHAAEALQRACAAMTLEADRARVRAIASPGRG